MLLERFAGQSNEPLVVGIDDTIERRRGAKIKARGIYRDPVRSSKGHFVKASGLRWLSVMLLAEGSWAGRIWALPFLTVLCPSQRYYAEARRSPKKLTDWARQVLLQRGRWLPHRRLVAVCDSSFSAIEFLAAVRMVLWRHMSFSISQRRTEMLKIPSPVFERLTRTLAYAA